MSLRSCHQGLPTSLTNALWRAGKIHLFVSSPRFSAGLRLVRRLDVTCVARGRQELLLACLARVGPARGGSGSVGVSIFFMTLSLPFCGKGGLAVGALERSFFGVYGSCVILHVGR